jgi:hypothetical protein
MAALDLGDELRKTVQIRFLLRQPRIAGKGDEVIQISWESMDELPSPRQPRQGDAGVGIGGSERAPGGNGAEQIP